MWVVAAIAFLFCLPLAVFAAEPRVLLGGCRLEFVACEPDIVTPIGMDFDREVVGSRVLARDARRGFAHAGAYLDHDRRLAPESGAKVQWNRGIRDAIRRQQLLVGALLAARKAALSEDVAADRWVCHRRNNDT